MATTVNITMSDSTFRKYGRAEIKRSLQKNVFRALMVSITLHLMIIGSYYLFQYFDTEEGAPFVGVRIMKYSELGPPPSLMNTEQIPVTAVAVTSARPTIGIPVPVPDVEVNPEQTIATQQELSQVQSPVMGESKSGNDIVVKEDLQIEEEPAPDAFVPVEKLPNPVRQVKPEYPDIARRAGIEGTVWVKILVDKQGKSKKAIVIKSDAEIFNEAALQAALQWVFTPAIMNSGPVAVWVAVPFRFQLNKSST